MIDTLRNDLLVRGLSDMLQLVSMASAAREHLPDSADEGDVIRATLNAIQDLLESGDAIAGDVGQDPDGLLRVRSWGLSPSDTVKRIENEGHAIGRILA